MVLKNQTILQIINSTPEVNIVNAKLSLQLAQQNYAGNAAVLNGIKNEIASATLKFNNDAVNY